MGLRDWISLRQAEKRFKFSHIYLRNLIRRGRLRGNKIGRDWFTKERWVRNYLSSRSLKNIPKKYRRRKRGT